MLNNLDMRNMNVWISVDEMLGEDCTEEFRWRDWILLCDDVGGLLLGVCWNNDRVVGFGVATVR